MVGVLGVEPRQRSYKAPVLTVTPYAQKVGRIRIRFEQVGGNVISPVEFMREGRESNPG